MSHKEFPEVAMESESVKDPGYLFKQNSSDGETDFTQLFFAKENKDGYEEKKKKAKMRFKAATLKLKHVAVMVKKSPTKKTIVSTMPKLRGRRNKEYREVLEAIRAQEKRLDKLRLESNAGGQYESYVDPHRKAATGLYQGNMV